MFIMLTLFLLTACTPGLTSDFGININHSAKDFAISTAVVGNESATTEVELKDAPVQVSNPAANSIPTDVNEAHSPVIKPVPALTPIQDQSE